MPYTELIRERLRFLEIDQSVVEKLQIAKRMIEPELDHMLENFYAHILDEPPVKRVFSDDSSIERAREAQKKHWLQTLFGGNFDSSYFDKAQRIGRTHARVGLTPDWYIGGYSKMLAQFVQHVAVVSRSEQQDPGPIIDAVCKAILLDLDLVIHCYLQAKDEQMLEILARATNFTADMEALYAELAAATAQTKETVATISKNVVDEELHKTQVAKLNDGIDALAITVRRIDERLGQLKTGDRLYAHKAGDTRGVLARLKARITGE